MFKAGFQFAPGFRIQKFLGRGQFGQVWQVVAPGGTVAAVKFIDLNAGEGQKEYEGIKRVKQIRQANLMPITAIWKLDEHGKAIDEVPDAAVETQDLSAYDPSSQDTQVTRPDETISVNQQASWLAVAMLLGGNSLDMQLRELAEEGITGIPYDRLISYMQDAAKGLDFLNQKQHDLGHGPVAIQHCDVKPSNIVTIGNSAVICDFGLAKILNRSQATTDNAAGTPHYMAPEAIVGAPSVTTDQYSLAVTYYHLRTGQLPATGESVWQVLEAHRNGQLNFDKVDLAERQVLQRATDIDWNKRYQSCAELVEALRDGLRGVAPAVQAINADDQETLDLQAADTSLDHSINGESESNLGGGDRSRMFLVAVAGAGAIAVVAALMLGPFSGASISSNDSQNESDGASNSKSASNNQSGMTTVQMLTSALAKLDQDENSAIDLFTKAIEQDASLSNPIVATLTNEEPIQKLFLGLSSETAVDQGNVLVAVGLSPPPIVHPLPKIASDGYSIDLSTETNRWTKGDGQVIPAALAMAPNSRALLVGAGSSLNVFSLSLSDTSQTIPLKRDGPAGEVLAVAWHPSNRIIVSAHDAGEIGVWELPGNHATAARALKRSRFFPTTWTATSLSIDPSGKWLVALTEDGDIQVFEWSNIAATLEVQQAPKSQSIKSLGTSTRLVDFVSVAGPSNGEQLSCVAAGGEDGEVTLWKLPSGPQEHEPENLGRINAHSQSVESLHAAVHNDSPLIVSSGSDGTVSVWRPESHETEPINRSFGAEPIAATVVSADGRWIAMGNEAGEVWVWDWVKNPDKPLLVFDSASWIDDVMFDLQEDLLIAAGDDQTIRLWNLRQLKMLALVGKTIQIEVDEAPQVKFPKVAFETH